jgi:Dyp-type peroxidase family
MGGTAVTHGAVDFRDVQGLVRFGYKHLKAARYVLVRVRDRRAAQAWLAHAQVTSAEYVQPPPSSALHVALTAEGLASIGVPAAVRRAFSPEFLGGMADEPRARRLGDVGANDPSSWEWGGRAGVPHVLVMWFTRDGATLDGFVTQSMGPAFAAAFDVQRMLGTSDLDGIEPFGFIDGLSQPAIDWDQTTDPASRALDYSDVAALGEFLLGYEYGKYTDRPLVTANASSALLPAAADDPAMKDVGRNGTYLVFRQLRQDVRAFWRFLHDATGGDAAALDRLSSAMVGRTRTGQPLVRPTDDASMNAFTFADDPGGVRCPLGAHIRRANPRNADYPGRPTGLSKLLASLGASSKGFRDDLVSPVRFHRVVRRGREYGSTLSPEDALQPAPPDDPERGIHFVCLNANIGRQFEFLQNAWLMNSGFADLRGETDPLVGGREGIAGCPAAGDFTMPRRGAAADRVTGLPQFVTVTGGEYFFLPGLSALRYLAGAAP